mgnify:CR=1 FL=1
MSHRNLSKLADEYYEWTLRTSPVAASMRGIHDYDTELGEFSREAEDRQIAELRDMTARARAISPWELDTEDQITREVLIFEAENAADVAETRLAEFMVSHTMGIQAMFPVIVPQLPIETAEHADAYIERFSKIPQAYAEANARLAEGVANGRTPMASTAHKTVEQIDAMLAAPLDQDPFTRAQLPAGMDEAEWRGRLVDLARDHVRPGLQAYRDMIAETVVPAGRSDDQPGLSWLPDGEATYSRLVKQHTSLPLDPEEIHHLGLRQVEMLADEYKELGSEVLGTTDLNEIFSRLRDDPDLHFTAGADVVAASEVAMA